MRRGFEPEKGSVRGLLILTAGLVLAGCETAPPAKGPTAALPPRVEARGAQALSSAPKPDNAPAKTPPSASKGSVAHPPPASRPAPRVESKPAPVITSKGAEKLIASQSPATAGSAEKTVGKVKPIESHPPKAHADPGTSAPVAELIVQGPPHPEEVPRSRRPVIWIGLGVAGAVLAVLVSLYVRRREAPEPAPALEVKEFDSMRADGMLTKEPLNQP